MKPNEFIMLLVLALAALAPAAHAQVFKCVGKGGLTTYSDTPCGAGTEGHALQRELANNSGVQMHDRSMAGQAHNQTGPQHLALDSGGGVQAPTVRNASNDWQIRNDERSRRVEESSVTEQARRAKELRAQERAERPRPPPRPSMVTCSGGFCNDDVGGVYNRSGNFMTGPNGQTCTRAGNMWQCN